MAFAEWRRRSVMSTMRQWLQSCLCLHICVRKRSAFCGMVRRKSIKHEVGGSGATPRWRIRDPALFACRQGKAWVDLAMGATPEPHPPSRSQTAATMPSSRRTA